MSVPLELVDRYWTTFVDFWGLRPRKFLPAVERQPDKYLSPMQFLAVSLGLVFSVIVAAISLSLTALQSVSGAGQVGEPKALATRELVTVFGLLFLGALFFRLISIPWPVRGRASFRKIFEFYSFAMAVIIPLSAVDVLVRPYVTDLVARNVVPLWVNAIPFLVGLVWGSILWFFYILPGVAYLNGVSTLRQLTACVIWPGVAGFIIGFVWGLLKGLSAS